MLKAGALDEIEGLSRLGVDPALPAMRAHGVPELLAFRRGEFTLAEAERRAVLATTQYTKRQSTWFRHRTIVDPCLVHTIHARFADKAQFSESDWRALMQFVKSAG